MILHTWTKKAEQHAKDHKLEGRKEGEFATYGTSLIAGSTMIKWKNKGYIIEYKGDNKQKLIKEINILKNQLNDTNLIVKTIYNDFEVWQLIKEYEKLKGVFCNCYYSAKQYNTFNLSIEQWAKENNYKIMYNLTQLYIELGENRWHKVEHVKTINNKVYFDFKMDYSIFN